MDKYTHIRLRPEEKEGVKKCSVLNVSRPENDLENNQRKCFLLFSRNKSVCLLNNINSKKEIISKAGTQLDPKLSKRKLC